MLAVKDMCLAMNFRGSGCSRAGCAGRCAGDRRVVYPWIGCGECAVCQRGEEHLCTPGRALGIVAAGGFATHVLIPHSRYLFDKGAVPDALAATYACSGLTAYGAIKKLGKLNPADEVVIIGAGGVGMMAIQIARALGIDPIVVDIDPAKLEAAQQLGVTRTYDSSDMDSAKTIRKANGGVYAALILSVQNPVSITGSRRCAKEVCCLLSVCLAVH